MATYPHHGIFISVLANIAAAFRSFVEAVGGYFIGFWELAFPTAPPNEVSRLDYEMVRYGDDRSRHRAYRGRLLSRSSHGRGSWRDPMAGLACAA